MVTGQELDTAAPLLVLSWFQMTSRVNKTASGCFVANRDVKKEAQISLFARWKRHKGSAAA